MVRLPLQNRARPVELLGENQAHHDVREGELREGQLRVLAGIDGLGETVGATDDEGERLQPRVGTLLDELRELNGGLLLAALVPQHHVFVRLYLLENQFTLAFLLFLHRHGLGVLQIGNRHHLVREIGGNPARIVLDGLIEDVAVGFADPYQLDFHSSSVIGNTMLLFSIHCAQTFNSPWRRC